MKIKEMLLKEVMTLESHPEKYSKAYLNIDTVLKIEKKENNLEDNTVLKEVRNKFEELTQLYNSFKNEIPLKIIEYYFMINRNELRNPVYIEYGDKELNDDIKYYDLYLELEDFYSQLFYICSLMLSQYSIEVKVNTTSSDDSNENKYL